MQNLTYPKLIAKLFIWTNNRRIDASSYALGI